MFSDFESLGGRIFGISEILSDSGSDQSLFHVAEEPIPSTMGDYQKGEDILNGLAARIKQEIMFCPAEDVEAGMEARAKEDLDKMLELTREFITGVDDFIQKHAETVSDVKEKWEPINKATLFEALAHKKAISIRVSR